VLYFQQLVTLTDTKLWALQNQLFKENSLHLESAFPVKPAAQPVPQQADQGGKKKFKWNVGGIDDAHKEDLKYAKPVADLSCLQLDAGIKGVLRSESGSEGVFFVTLPGEAGASGGTGGSTGAGGAGAGGAGGAGGGGIFVVKNSKSIFEEVFSNLIAQSFGVYSPKVRVLHVASQEGNKLLDDIVAIDKQGVAIHALMSAEYFLLKEFVYGSKNFDKCTGQEIQDFYFEDYPGKLSVNGAKNLQNLGVILAVDVLTNYSDRLPFIWVNPGNSGNLMVTNKGQFISIENGIATFATNSPPYESYMKKVTSLLEDLAKDPNSIKPAFANINEKFLEFTGVNLEDIAVLEIQAGFVSFLKKMAAKKLPKETFSNWISLLQEFSPKMVGSDSVNVEFLNNILGLYQHYGDILQHKQ